MDDRRGLQSLTANEITSILKSNGYDAVVTDFTTKIIGTGQMGQNIRFDLTYADAKSAAKGPDAVVGKFPSPSSEFRETVKSAYLNEINFYRLIRPGVDMQTPDILATSIDEETGDFVLLMEDLAPAEQGDQIRGCTVEQATTAVSELAKLHGPNWGKESLKSYAWLNGTDDAPIVPVDLFKELWPAFKERYADRITTREVELGEALAANVEAYAEPFAGPRCAIHGDYRLDNMLFGGPSGGYPLAVVDWQTLAYGSPIQDLAYFMGTSPLPEDRARVERDLLMTYLEGLKHYGVSDYPFDHLWADYRRYSWAGYLMAIIASILVVRTDRGDDMFMAMAKRSAQLADELDAIELWN